MRKVGGIFNDEEGDRASDHELRSADENYRVDEDEPRLELILWTQEGDQMAQYEEVTEKNHRSYFAYFLKFFFKIFIFLFSSSSLRPGGIGDFNSGLS